MTRGSFTRTSDHDGMTDFGEPTFEADFSTADENTIFADEPVGREWEANGLFEQNMVSPTSLHSFNAPRNSTAFDSKMTKSSSNAEFASEPSPRVIIDSLPFRGRFASAAMISQQTNASFQLDESFRSQEDISPKQLFSSPMGDKSSGPISPVHNSDDEYVSFGNQSVFSDITESEMSGNHSYPIISPSRNLRRKARQSRKFATRSPPRQPLFKVHEELEGSTDGMRKESAILRKGEYSESQNFMEQKSDLDNEKNISTRLASFFANRSISQGNDLNKKEIGRDEIGVGHKLPLRYREGSGDLPTPPSSTSDSSNGYVGWPGTLDRNGNTVIENSSYTSADDLSSSRQSLPNCSKRADTTAKKWLEQKTTSIPERYGTKGKSLESNRDKQTRVVQPTAKPVVSAARSRVNELKRRFEERNRKREEVCQEASTSDVVDLDVVPTDLEPTPSDYHLAAAISRAKSKSNRLDISLDSTIPEDEVVDLDEYNLNDSFLGSIATDGEDAEHEQSGAPKIDTTASLLRVQSARKSLANIVRKNGSLQLFNSSSSSSPVNSGPIRLSEAALKQKEQLSSSFQTVAHGANVKGYRGFINKTADVPNLMDDLESVTSASTVATNRKQDRTDSESDVFDGVCSGSSAGGNNSQSPTFQRLMQRKQINHDLIDAAKECGEMKIVKVNGNIFSIQTSSEAFENRKTSLEFDATLTESDTDYARRSHRRREGDSKMPGRYARQDLDDESASYSSNSASNSQSSENSKYYDLSCYMVDSAQVRKLVKAYRTMSQFVNGDNTSQREEDSKKTFALFEMRSRIMETDIERGFDRAGGTVTVDDIVLTQYYRASCRVRDAVIVSKAWHDGATPKDALTALNLVGGNDFFIKRSSRFISSTDSATLDSHDSIDSTCSRIQTFYERVDWIDDTEFSLIRCFGANTLRGSAIFTVGDCQSMLLKLTYEHCENLRVDLKEASSRELVAEQMLKDEGGHSSSMTDAELEYLEVMEEVKTLSTSLVKAEKAFDMVKKEITNLVQQYEEILEHIDNSSDESSSFDSAEERDIGDVESESSEDSRFQRERLARRVQKAELKAEVAAREAQLAKVEVEKTRREAERIHIQKEQELNDLKGKLDDLEAKSAIMASDFEAKLKSHTLLTDITQKIKDNSLESATSAESLLYAASTVGTDPDQNEVKARIKAKFRQRRSNLGKSNQEGQNAETLSDQQVHQRLAFYERSLKAVNEK